MDHECNAYCKDDMHCVVIYAGQGWTLDKIAKEIERERYVSVLDLSPAHEAPPITVVPQGYVNLIWYEEAGTPVSGLDAYLLRFKFTDDLPTPPPT